MAGAHPHIADLLPPRQLQARRIVVCRSKFVSEQRGNQGATSTRLVAGSVMLQATPRALHTLQLKVLSFILNMYFKGLARLMHLHECFPGKSIPAFHKASPSDLLTSHSLAPDRRHVLAHS